MSDFTSQNTAYTRFYLLIRSVIVVLLVVCFFFFYNSFLVDRNLELLKFSLSNIAVAETASSASYIAPLIQFQYIDELTSDRLDTLNLLGLQHSADIMQTSTDRPLTDITSIMTETIKRKELEKAAILQFLDKVNGYILRLFKRPRRVIRPGIIPGEEYIDSERLEKLNDYERNGKFEEAITLCRDIIDRFPNAVQTPGIKLRLGFLLHKKGEFEEAEKLYKDIISQYPASPEANVSRALIERLKKKAGLEKKAQEISSKIEKSIDKGFQQKSYYQLGLIEFSALNLEKAKEYLSKAASIIPDNDIAIQSLLRLSSCEKLLGKIDAAIKVLKEATVITKDPELKMQLRYQLAQILLQKKDYKEYAAVLEDIIKEYPDNRIRPLLLFQQGSTLLFDSKDIAKAKEVFEKLRVEFPALTLVYPGSYFADNYVPLDVPPKKPEEMERLYRDSWVENIVPKKVLSAIEAASNRFVNRINEGVKEIIVTQAHEVEAGDYATIELTEKRLNNYIKDWFPKGVKERVWDVSVKFEGEQKLKVLGTVYLENEKPLKGFISGKLEKVNYIKEPYWVSGSKRADVIIFTYLVKESKIGNMAVPQYLMNVVLKPCVMQFNKDFPLKFKEFKLDKDTILFAGPIREDLIAELNAEAYGRRHMAVKEAGIGFKDAIRKEEIKKTGLEERKGTD